MNEALTDEEMEELESLERWVFAMRLPMLFTAFVVYAVVIATVIVGVVAAGWMMVAPLIVLAFLLLPGLLVIGSGVAAMPARSQPDSLRYALKLQTVFWWIAFVQALGFIVLVSIGFAAVLLAF